MSDDQPPGGNIVAFPDKMLTSWKVYERLITEWLAAETSNDSPRIAAICDRLRPIYLAAAQPLRATYKDGEDAVAGINQWVASTIFPLLQELAIRQMKVENADRIMRQLFDFPGGAELFVSAGISATPVEP